jgi:hypothetical protein
MPERPKQYKPLNQDPKISQFFPVNKKSEVMNNAIQNRIAEPKPSLLPNVNLNKSIPNLSVPISIPEKFNSRNESGGLNKNQRNQYLYKPSRSIKNNPVTSFKPGFSKNLVKNDKIIFPKTPVSENPKKSNHYNSRIHAYPLTSLQSIPVSPYSSRSSPVINKNTNSPMQLPLKPFEPKQNNKQSFQKESKVWISRLNTPFTSTKINLPKQTREDTCNFSRVDNAPPESPLAKTIKPSHQLTIDDIKEITFDRNGVKLSLKDGTIQELSYHLDLNNETIEYSHPDCSIIVVDKGTELIAKDQNNNGIFVLQNNIWKTISIRNK